MTALAEETRNHATGSPEAPLSPRWREVAGNAQRDALPGGLVVVSCTASLGSGGLGRHLSETVDALDRGGQPAVCICGPTSGTRSSRSSRSLSGPSLSSSARSAGRSPRHGLVVPYLSTVLRRVPVPTSRGVRARAFFAEFDAHAAARLPAADHLLAFNGQALTQFRAARRAGYTTVSLLSANPHLRRLARQHALAHASIRWRVRGQRACCGATSPSMRRPIAST